MHPSAKGRSSTANSDENRAVERGQHPLVLILAVAGLVSTIFWVAWLSPHFELGSNVLSRPIPQVVVLLVASFGFYVLAVSRLRRLPSSRWLAWVIWSVAIVLRLVMLPTPPIQEVDIYRYIWDGWVTAQGVSPYEYSPGRVSIAGEEEKEPRLSRLVKASKRDPSIREVLDSVHYSEFSTVYPPVSQAVFWAVAKMTPDGSNLIVRRLGMKLAIVLFDCGILWLLIRWLQFVARPVGFAALYGWCPLVIKEFANSGHLDSIAVFFSVAGIYAVTRASAATLARPSSSLSFKCHQSRIWALFSVVLLACGVGAKLYPMVFAPIVIMHIRRSWSFQGALVATLLFVVLVGALLVPVWRRHVPQTPGIEQSDGLLADNETGFSSSPSGFVAFFRYWEMNDFLFMLVFENIKPHQPEADSQAVWFAVTPDSFRRFLTEPISRGMGLETREVAFLLTRVVTSLVCLAIAFWLIRLTPPTSSGEEVGSMAFYTVAWFWLLLPTQNPWYWIWAVAFLPFIDKRIWWWLSGCVLLYYLRFWFDYHYTNEDVLGTGLQGSAFFDFVITWLEYGPWFLVLALTFMFRGSRRSHLE